MSEQVNPLPYPADAAATEAPIRDVRELMLGELAQYVVAADERAFRARQVMGWLWRRGADSFDTMSDLGTGFRAHLKSHFKISPTPSATVARSADGTRKLLVALGDGEAIESVIIPAGERVTLCLSSQAGCAMACEFCATALMGLHRNLTAGEILGQIAGGAARTRARRATDQLCFHGDGRAARELSASHRGADYHDLGVGDGYLAATYHRLDRGYGPDDGTAADRISVRIWRSRSMRRPMNFATASRRSTSAIRSRCSSMRASGCRSSGASASPSNT